MPLLWLSIAFLAGIAASAATNLNGFAWLAVAAAALLLPLLRRPARRLSLHLPRLQNLSQRISAGIRLPVPAFALLAVLALGAARYQSAQPDLGQPGFITHYNDLKEDTLVEGILSQPPDVRDGSVLLKVEAERLRPVDGNNFIPVRGGLQARVPPGGDWHYGDRLSLQGRLATPPQAEDFSYRDYLARQGVYSTMEFARAKLVARNQGSPLLAWIYAFRERCLRMVYRLYPDPEASLLAGILLGVDSGIPQRVQQAFQDTGTTHIIAISGFNISIISGLFASLFIFLLGKRRRLLAAGLSLMVIAFYAVLVGAGASVIRAALMGGMSLFAAQIGRRQDGLNSLAFVAAAMALHDPNVPWDVGFQLSFMATLGLVLYAEPLSQAFVRLASGRLPLTTVQRLAGPVGEYFLFTFAATVTTLPVTAYHFQRISLTAFVANPLVLPAQPPVMVLGGLAVLLGLAYQPLGQAAAYLAWPFVAYTIRVVELMASIPAGVLVLGRVALGWVLLYYGVLFLATFAGRPVARLRSLGKFVKPSVALAGLGIVTVVVWRAALSAPDGRLHLTLLEVGSGDALLIQTPTGRAVLVDGGPSPSKLSDALGRRLPLFNRQLDYLVVAAPGEGQVAALPQALERFPASQVVWGGPAGTSAAARLLREGLSQSEVQPISAQPGQALDLGKGAILRVLRVGNDGTALLLEWGKFRTLLPVGMDKEMLKTLLDDPRLVPVNALLLAERGSAELNPPRWIAKLRPQVVLLSVGAGDREGRPDVEVLEAVKGYTLLRTDRNGWIELITDGEQMWVEVERK